MSFERATPEQRRDRFLRLAEKARLRALEVPETHDIFLQVAESWELMARSALEFAEIHVAASHTTTYRRVRNWLRQNAGHCCCDECLGYRVDALSSSVGHAVRRVSREEGFHRFPALCDYCGEKRVITKATANAL